MDALQERRSRLSEASLRINESLEFDEVLQGALDSASSLAAARYGVMTLLDDDGRVQDFLCSGTTAHESGVFLSVIVDEDIAGARQSAGNPIGVMRGE